MDFLKDFDIRNPTGLSQTANPISYRKVIVTDDRCQCHRIVRGFTHIRLRNSPRVTDH